VLFGYSQILSALMGAHYQVSGGCFHLSKMYLDEAVGAHWPVRSSASSFVPTRRHLEDAFSP
jgi:hypothetical protein